VGPFGLEDVRLSLEQMQETGRLGLVPLSDVGRRLFHHVAVDDSGATAVRHGRPLGLALPDVAGPVAVFGPDGDLLALYEQRGEHAVPVAVLV
jgi:tRNA pseudouridine55 synthase